MSSMYSSSTLGPSADIASRAPPTASGDVTTTAGPAAAAATTASLPPIARFTELRVDKGDRVAVVRCRLCAHSCSWGNQSWAHDPLFCPVRQHPPEVVGPKQQMSRNVTVTPSPPTARAHTVGRGSANN
eukprot:m.50280 g.50280  ORF g.50280 m.50280 type:complete len:129 (-) comp9002_c0_seq2:22-408(-)